MPSTAPGAVGASPALRLAPLVVAVLGGLALLPGVSAGVALVAGIAVALTLGNPWPTHTRTVAQRALAASVIGLGAGMDLIVVGRVGLRGLTYTAAGIAVAFMLGKFLGRRLRVSPDISLLISVGTAICGGSAIAAVAPAIRAKDHDVSMSLVSIFLLNSVALMLFPAVGHALALSQDAFGTWCALAIHDTSSVVGAASQYGERALQVATAAKLARALWIVPVTIVLAGRHARVAQGRPEGPYRAKRPWFIGGFLLAAAAVTFIPGLRGVGDFVSTGAHHLLTATLFLIGLGLSRAALRALGLRPLLLAVGLWVTLAGGTLLAVSRGWIG